MWIKVRMIGSFFLWPFSLTEERRKRRPNEGKLDGKMGKSKGKLQNANPRDYESLHLFSLFDFLQANQCAMDLSQLL